ncbi:hypothetical protein N7539_000226 [Penicillium diatomitis]|uniref:Uncharacterized protein n=1 Tax=Penicillium diatomitis TaxID=2819901 RepID=A0A9W9XMA0_9EURO|nr:uncharacterized protein N7539_000226 [Penicillium diatomitis]KAJ5495110.1 hypothetical protein N7539_000226 [Penicillium diatomitis]
MNAQAMAAASRAMRPNASSSDSKAYDRVGGPHQVAIPPRRAPSSLRYTEQEPIIVNTFYEAAGVPPTPVQPEPVENEDCRPPNPAELPQIIEPVGLDGRLNSRASSYRRLRKAKSMFSTRAKSSQTVYSPSQTETPRNAFELNRGEFHWDLPRTLRPSPSPHIIQRQHSHVVRHAKSHDAAIELARSQFRMGSYSPEPMQERPSSFHRKKREQKRFRQTLRITSDNSPSLTSSPYSLSRWSSRSKSRALSASIKSGFRRIFGRSKPSGAGPEDAHERGDLSTPVPNSIAAAGQSLGHEGKTTVLARDPVPADSPDGDSLHTVTSRVTSWADSSVANTIKTHTVRRRQSLSLIEEHDDLNKHLPETPDASAERIPARSMRGGLSSQMSPSAIQNWANSNDLYSALMQQIRDSDARSTDEEIVFGAVPQHRAIPEKASSIRSQHAVPQVFSEESSAAGSLVVSHVPEIESPTPRRSQGLMRVPRVIRRSRNVRASRPIEDVFAASQVPDIVPSYEGADGDTDSVVFCSLARSQTRDDSPSIYSRTSGGTPEESSSRMIANVLDNETGTATIFASQRATYSSPNRTHDQAPSGNPRPPSLDWKKWMDSEIERIENTTPVREHTREGAQLGSDQEDDVFKHMAEEEQTASEKVKEGPAVLHKGRRNTLGHALKRQPSGQNNYSRPFSRASSMSTFLPSRGTRSLIHEKPSQPAVTEKGTGGPADLPAEAASPRESSIVRTVPPNQGKGPEPSSAIAQGPAREVSKRGLTQEQYRRYSARRPLTVGTSTNVRSMRSFQASHRMHGENTEKQKEYEELLDDYHQVQDSPSQISSKRMVEMFLESRRQEGAGHVDGTENGDAFV